MPKKKIIKNPVNNKAEYIAMGRNLSRTVSTRIVKGLSYMKNTTELKNARCCARCRSTGDDASNVGYKICLKRK